MAKRDGVSDEAAQREYEQRSWRELEAGRLPLRAQERLATMEADRAFTSDLSAAEHLAIRGVGFEPVGQVMGASVFQIGWTGGWDCGVTGFGRGRRPMGFGGAWNGVGGWNSGGFSGRGLGNGPSGGTGRTGSSGAGRYGDYLTCTTVTVDPWKQALLTAQRLAMGRLEQEATALGGDGVVAVRFHENQLPNGAIEFHVIGTAVRGPGERRPARPFTCDLSGQDVARLLHAGWTPVRLLYGLACVTRHDDNVTRWNTIGWINVELAGYTQLVLDARSEARLQLARDAARAGAEAAVLADTYETTSEHDCYLVEGGHDHVVRTTFVGTGIARLPDREGDLPPALPILRLDRNRRTDVSRPAGTPRRQNREIP